MKICLTSSAGGQLLQILQLESVYKKYDHFFLTFKKTTTESLAKKERVKFVDMPERNPLKILSCMLRSLIIFLKETPDVIISTGSGVTFPICLYAKIFGKRVIYIESFSRVDFPSFTGRLLYRFSDLFIVQWKPLLKYYKNAIYGGPIF
jgi:UDP-N-acetylglucosamine:LPS N-acetylglucosamine transferase